MCPSLEGRCFCCSAELEDIFFFATIMIHLPAKTPSACYHQFLLSSNPTALSLKIFSPFPWFGEGYCVPLFDNCVIPTSVSLLEVWLRHLPPTWWENCPGASASCGSFSGWGGPDNTEKHQLSDGRYLLPSFIYQTRGLLARMPVGVAMARVAAQRRPEPVSLKINSFICSLRRSFWSQH